MFVHKSGRICTRTAFFISYLTNLPPLQLAACTELVEVSMLVVTASQSNMKIQNLSSYSVLNTLYFSHISHLTSHI